MTKILLVEDDKSLREIYGVRLLAEGYDIVSAGDGEEALAMAIKEKPTLIISDVMMPKISGFDMLDILRSTTETRDIKVIMMTALSSEDQRARGEQLGADKYLVKSQVGIEDVVRTVHEVLGDSAGAAAPATEAPAETPGNTDAPAEPEASVAEETPTDAPAESAPQVESSMRVTTPSTSYTPQPKLEDDPAPVDEDPSTDAGPLPEQPDAVEGTLPQPTAPFSSPRPANFGEQAVVSPVASESEPASSDTGAATMSPEESNQLAQELSATPETITTQVDVTPAAPVAAAPAPAVEAPAEATTAPDHLVITPPSEAPADQTPPAAA